MKKLLISGLVAAAVPITAQTDNFTYIDYGFGTIDPDNSDSNNDDYASLSGAFETSGGPFIAFESTE